MMKTKTSSEATGIRTSPTLETSGTPISSNEFAQRAGLLMSLREACLASLQVLSDKCAVLTTSVGSGPKPSEWLARYDPSSASLRTRQQSLFSMTDEPGTELCQDWPRSGMICCGMFYPQPRLVQDICESASSSSLPTVTANDGKKGGEAYWKEKREADAMGAWNPGDSLPRKIAKLLPTLTTQTDSVEKSEMQRKSPNVLTTVKMKLYPSLLPTPTTRDYKDTPGMARTSTNKNGTERSREDQLPRRIYADASVVATGGMRLTPEFQCWLMGYHPDWLKPLRAALAMRLSRKSSNQSRGRSGK